MRDFKSRNRRVVVKDEGTGEVVSYVWGLAISDWEAEGGGGGRKQFGPAKRNDGEAIRVLFGNGRRKREGIMGGRDYTLLADLKTAPSHRRLGAASKIIEWGLSLVDAHLLPTYCEATPGCLRLSIEYGFRKVDTLSIDVRPWGRSEVIEHTILIRPAKKPVVSPDEVAISPFLTNADLAAFGPVEDRAFDGDDSKVKSETPTARTIAPLPKDASHRSEEKDNRPKSILALINQNIPLSDPDLRSSNLINNSITDPTFQYLKGFIPSTNQIIGWAKWNLCLAPIIQPDSLPWPAGANLAFIDVFFEQMTRAREKHMAGKPYLFWHAVVVLPEWQSKGVGTSLLEWGLEIADKKDLECWIDASEAGL